MDKEPEDRKLQKLRADFVHERDTALKKQRSTQYSTWVKAIKKIDEVKDEKEKM